MPNYKNLIDIIVISPYKTYSLESFHLCVLKLGESRTVNLKFSCGN